MENQEIVELFWQRDERAISETSVKYGTYCKTIAMNILKNAEDSEECVNDTYLKAWNTIPPQRPSLLSAYLGKITRNLAINMYNRKTADKRGKGSYEEALEELSDIVSGQADVEGTILKEELVAEISEFLKEKSEEKRYIFIRRYWYVDSIKDIAKNVKRSENSVSISLNRLRNELKKRFIEKGLMV